MTARLDHVLALATAIAVSCPQPAFADPGAQADADRHLRDGLVHYDREQYQRAIREFLAGYAVEPRREFLYALGQAERLSGDCPSAVVYYRRFLSRNPPERQATAAREHLETCTRALATGPAAATQTDAPDASAAATVEPPPVTRTGSPSPRWYRDGAGNGLLGAGAALIVAGGGFYLSARAAASAARGSESYPEFDASSARAASRQRTAVALTVGGVALIGGAIYRYLRVDAGRERAAVAIGPAAGGGVAVTCGGRF